MTSKDFSIKKKQIKEEAKKSKKYYKAVEDGMVEFIANDPSVIAQKKDHIPELSSQLFRNFCDVFQDSTSKGFAHLRAAILAVDSENGKLDIGDKNLYTLIV